MAAPTPSKTGITVQEIKDELLYGKLTQSPLASAPLSDDAILRRLRAAEDNLEHELNIFWQEKRIVSDALARGIAPSAYDLDDPPLDYADDMFSANRWGRFNLNWRPVKPGSITAFFIKYPGMTDAEAFKFPLVGIKPDYLFGSIQILPTINQPVNGFFATWLAQNLYRGLPRTLHVDYIAGFTPEVLAADHNDLLEVLRIRTVLLLFGIISTIRSGAVGSHSLSTDGLSQSESFMQGKYGPYSGEITLALENEQAILKPWRDSMRGPIMTMLGS